MPPETLVTGTTPDTGSQSTDAAQAPATTSATADTKPADGTAQTQTAEGQTSATDATAKDGDKTADSTDAKDGDKPAGAPEKYEFKAPEGTTFDPVLLGEFESVARDLNMTNEAAQKLVETMGPKVTAQVVAAQQAQFQQMNNGWIEATKTDKEFGGDKLTENLAVAKKALDATATPELRTLLNETGLGNHPEVIRHFLKIGKALSEDGFVPGGTAPNSGKSAAAVLYPNQK